MDAKKKGIWGSHGFNGPSWGLGETQGVITSVRGLRGLLGIMRVWEELEEVVRVIWPRKLQRGQEGAQGVGRGHKGPGEARGFWGY